MPVQMCNDMLDWFRLCTILGVIFANMLRSHVWHAFWRCILRFKLFRSVEPWSWETIGVLFVALVWRTLFCNVRFITGSIAPAVLRSLLKEFGIKTVRPSAGGSLERFRLWTLQHWNVLTAWRSWTVVFFQSLFLASFNWKLLEFVMPM